MQPIPTPTLIVPDANLPAPQLPDLSLWDYTDEAIQTWNQVNAAGSWFTIFQVIIVIGLVFGIIFMFVQLVNAITIERD